MRFVILASAALLAMGCTPDLTEPAHEPGRLEIPVAATLDVVTEDVTVPVLTGVIVAPRVIDASQSAQTVLVTRSATDDLSGVAYAGTPCTNATAGLVFTSPTGSQTARMSNCSFTLTSGSDLDGEFSSQATFPRFAESGVWAMTSMILEDQAGNMSFLGAADLADLGIFATVNVVSQADVTPPVLTGVSVDPQRVETWLSSQTVLVTRSATDDLSGVAYGGTPCTNATSGWVFTSPSGGQTVRTSNCSFVLSAGSALDGEFSSQATFPQFAESGTWLLTSMILEDQARNMSFLGPNELADLGISASVEVVSEADVTPPVLTGVSVSPQRVETWRSSQAVLVTRSATDDISGVAYGGTPCTNATAGWVFTSPSGGQTVRTSNCSFVLSSGSARNGEFSSQVTFPRFAESGTWLVTSMILEDQAGNMSFLGVAELADLGIGASVEVISTVEVSIDIKPGSETNPINLGAGGVTPVAILSGDGFDATTIDRSSLSFGPAGATPAHAALGHVEDVDGDGDMDLVTHYRTVDLGLTETDSSACVTGVTTIGVPFEGCDVVAPQAFKGKGKKGE